MTVRVDDDLDHHRLQDFEDCALWPSFFCTREAYPKIFCFLQRRSNALILLLISGITWQILCLGTAAGNSLPVKAYQRSLRVKSCLELRGGGGTGMAPTTRASKVAVAGVHGGTDSVSVGTDHVVSAHSSSFSSVSHQTKSVGSWAATLWESYR
jgi:hypothetical protein